MHLLWPFLWAFHAFQLRSHTTFDFYILCCCLFFVLLLFLLCCCAKLFWFLPRFANTIRFVATIYTLAAIIWLATVVILIFVNVVVVVVTLVTVVAIRWHAAKYATNGRPHKSHPNNAFHSQQETSTEKDREREVLQENGLPGCHCKLSKIADFLLTKIANIFWLLPKHAYKNAGQTYSNWN